MKIYGKNAEQVIDIMLEQFESGNIPDALAQTFLPGVDSPCADWSRMNRLSCVFAGTQDARGFKQWQSVGRKVIKGKKAFYILKPMFRSEKYIKEECKNSVEETEARMIPFGFKNVPVFRFEDTEAVDDELWAKNEPPVVKNHEFIESLPLIEVAKAWNLRVEAYNAEGMGALGMYHYSNLRGISINVGVENLSTWAHELVHAADHKNNTLVKGKDRDNEIVAELGGATLLAMLGFETEADKGGCWEYIKFQSGGDNQKTFNYCRKLVNRIAKNIELILETSKSVEMEVA